MSNLRFLDTANLGTCPTCMSLTAAFLCLGLLLLGLGSNIDEPALRVTGQLATAVFGFLGALHAGFFFARRRPQIDRILPTVAKPVPAGRGCGCSGRKA